MDPSDILGLLIIVTLVIIAAQVVKALDPNKKGGEGKPCHENGKPHTWQHVQVPNQFGEQVWIHYCSTCKRRPGQF